jgi:tetratricopeptide (TPR) repeat protein
LVKYGIYLNEQRDFEGAYKAFKKHIEIPELDMMQNEKIQKEMPRDSIYTQYKYYAAIFAVQAQLHEQAIAVLEQLKDGDYEAVSVNQFLYQEYVELKDTVKFVATLQDAIARFPQESWFLQNLINYYINSGQESMAIDYLDLAITREPNVGQYYNSKGSILARIGRFEESFAEFDKAIALEPTNALFLSSLGYAYIDLGNKINDDAAYLSAKEYKKEKVKIDAAFKKALEYFEKAYELEPTNDEYKRSLRTMYYRLGMNDKYEALAD